MDFFNSDLRVGALTAVFSGCPVVVAKFTFDIAIYNKTRVSRPAAPADLVNFIKPRTCSDSRTWGEAFRTTPLQFSLDSGIFQP